MEKIEIIVNKKIVENGSASTTLEDLEEAKKKGAIAMFGEKYEDQVRVVQLGDFSVELCGGTHVHSTGDIGAFCILSERSIQTGVRRIEAVTRLDAMEFARSNLSLIESLGHQLKAPKKEIESRVLQLQDDLKKERQARMRLEEQVGNFLGSALKEKAIKENGLKIVVEKIEENVDLRKLAHSVYDNQPDYVGLLASVSAEKVSLIAFASPKLVEGPWSRYRKAAQRMGRNY